MKSLKSRFNRHLVPLALAVALAGCAQPPALIMDDSANFLKHQNLIMVPEPSGASTNMGIWVSMHGGG